MSDGKKVLTVDMMDVRAGQYQDTIKRIAEMEVFPIDTGDGTSSSVTQLYVSSEQYLQLEYAGDLLACGAISPKEWAKLKMLLKSENEENRKLATKILSAKGGIF